MTGTTEHVAALMRAFGERTGLTSDAPPRRYLWTDAFAVCACVSLHRRTGDAHWLASARALIDRVHGVLGRHRPDDPRRGWISQYYHYLTCWMHALARASEEMDDPALVRHALDLARTAHRAFAHRTRDGMALYWKMSIDLSRPLVPSSGHHDPLDGLAVSAEVHALARSREPRGQAGDPASRGDAPDGAPGDASGRTSGHDDEGARGLGPELAELAAMCRGRRWATTDALGIGGLLTAAWQLARLRDARPGPDPDLLTRVLSDAARSLDLVATAGYVAGPANRRLAFRELGLSLGLAAAGRLRELAPGHAIADRTGALAAIERLAPRLPLRARIEEFWLEPSSQESPTWSEHEDINAVMLATSLAPEGYLS